jgi:transglutaminase-like putative cysteine protease
MPRSYFKAPFRQRAINSGLLIASIAALVVFCAPPRVNAADSAPDWLRALAKEPLPTYSKDPIAVELLDELQTTVQDNGEIDTRHRIAYRLLRPEAKDEYGYVGVPFDSQTKIISFKAWTITPTGHEFALNEKDALETSASTYEVFSDEKVKILKVSDAEPGSVVGYEYVQKKRPFVFEDDWAFQSKIPVRHARLSLQLPTGWEYSATWFNYPDQKPQIPGTNQFTWEVSDVPAIEIEPDMPPMDSIAAAAGLKYFPRDPAMRARTTGSWKDLGLWYSGLTESSRIATPEIQKKVTELTAGVTDPVAKMEALTAYVQRQIRYVAIEVGIGGYQPHPAADVFNHQYGDCKDKATLLSAMLHLAGIESYYVVIDSDRGVVRPDYPSMNFDHVIVAIQLPDTIKSGELYAVVNDPKLGRLLFFDPTNEYAPLGYLPWYLQDSYGLVVAPEGGELISLPLLPPATNRLLRTAKFTLSPGGDLTGDVQEAEWGAPAQDRRDQFLSAQPAKRAEILEGFLGEFLNNFTLVSASLGNLEKYDEMLSIHYKFVSQEYAKSAGDLLFVRPRVMGDKYANLLTLFAQDKPRQYPVAFDEATRQDDVFDIALPAGFAVDGLPKAVQVDCDYATYKSESTVADGVLHYHRTFEIKNVEVPTTKLPEIRTFLRQVAADQEASAVLRRTTTSP